MRSGKKEEIDREPLVDLAAGTSAADSTVLLRAWPADSEVLEGLQQR